MFQFEKTESTKQANGPNPRRLNFAESKTEKHRNGKTILIKTTKSKRYLIILFTELIIFTSFNYHSYLTNDQKMVF